MGGGDGGELRLWPPTDPGPLLVRVGSDGCVTSLETEEGTNSGAVHGAWHQLAGSRLQAEEQEQRADSVGGQEGSAYHEEHVTEDRATAVTSFGTT